MGQKMNGIQKREFTVHFTVNQPERDALAVLSAFEGVSFSECMRLVVREALSRRGITLGVFTMLAKQTKPQPEVGNERG
jgi:hypothetical protein